MRHCSKALAVRAMEVFESHGYDTGADIMGVKKETMRRYVRQARNDIGEQGEQIDESVIRQIRERYTDAELKAIARGGNSLPTPKKPAVSFDGEVVTIGLMTDTHIGSKYTDDYNITRAFEIFADNNVDMICHCGDVFEGMSNRTGHVYECTEIGYAAQLGRGKDIFSEWTDTDIYMIDGNHDRWFAQSVGAHIVSDLCDSQDNLIFLGHDEGDIDVNGACVRLWHGLDASSYAISYRIQKLVESFTGGNKPNVLLLGHVHKAGYIFDRHVHCISAGCIQSQSKWMRGKRIAAHTGFWIVSLTINNAGVAAVETKFFPFYE